MAITHETVAPKESGKIGAPEWNADHAFDLFTNADIAADAAIDESKLNLNYPTRAVPIITYQILNSLVGNTQWTNMPAALSFWFSSATSCKAARQIDLTNYTQCRLRVIKLATAGAANAKLILRYKASPWTQTVANYSDIGTSEVSVAINVQNTFLDTGWIDLAAGAKADVFVALVGSGGDGAIDPRFGDIIAEFK